MRFDSILEAVIESLPEAIQRLLEEAPVIVDDRPSRRLLAELGMDPREDTLCGLHSGTPLTQRSIDQTMELPETIHLFREGIVEQAGGWEPQEVEGERIGGEESVTREIRITLLHEIGHHFGLDEEDLARLGYE